MKNTQFIYSSEFSISMSNSHLAPRPHPLKKQVKNLTSKNVGFVHEVSAKHCHPARFSVFEKIPDNVARTRVHPSCRLVQQQHLHAKGWARTGSLRDLKAHGIYVDPKSLPMQRGGRGQEASGI